MCYAIYALSIMALLIMIQNTIMVLRHTDIWEQMLNGRYKNKRGILWSLKVNQILVYLFMLGYVIFLVVSIVNKVYDLMHLLVAAIMFGGSIYVHITNQVTNRLTQSIEASYKESIEDLSSQVNYIIEEIGEYIFELDMASGQFKVTDTFKKDFAIDENFENIFGEGFKGSGLFKEEEITDFINEVELRFAKGNTFSGNLRMKYSDGKYRWNRIKLFCYKDIDGKCSKVTGIIQDVDTEEREKQRLVRRAERDLLTGFYNKVTFENLVTKYLKSKYVNQAYFIMIDVNKFKQINDTFGHYAGDLALKALSNCILEVFSQNNVIVGRSGGDEFMILLKDYEINDSIQQALREIKDKINDKLEVLIPDTGQVEKFSVSAGLVEINEDQKDFNEIYNQADKLMYEDKKLSEQL